MKFKVCGMKYQDNIAAVANLRPDYLGFIFYDKSPRNFNGIIPTLPNTINKVGVFVDADSNYLLEKVEEYSFDFVQLHGNESPKYCSILKGKGVKIIKAFSILDEFNFNRLLPFEDVCEFFLFDTKGTLVGGNGFTFDWEVLKGYSSKKPFFLSGGIGVDQIEKINAFSKSKASKYCRVIDVNSRFEIEPGLKNIEELKIFKS